MNAGLLKDDEIVGAVLDGKLEIEPLSLPNPFGKDSVVQPASLDLAVGEIWIPSEAAGAQATKAPSNTHILRSGETVVVETREKLTLGAEMAAFGFPPAEVSRNGILMTNPGHVDPGFSGTMRLTLINMGHRDYPLVAGQRIVTLLVFELSGNARRSYADRRNGQIAATPSQEIAGGLARDFVDFERRAREGAKEEIRKVGIRAELAKLWVPAVFAVLGALATGLFTIYVPLRDKADRSQLEEVRGSVEAVKRDAEQVRGLSERLGQLSSDLDRFQAKSDASAAFDTRLSDVEQRIERLEPRGEAR